MGTGGLIKPPQVKKLVQQAFSPAAARFSLNAKTILAQ
jgi:hypothetical protein